MRKIVSGLFISLDGVVESPEKWHFPYFNDEMGAAVGELTARSDAMLFGRRGYVEFASHWPNQPAGDPMTDHFNNAPKYVVSSTLDKVEWNNSTLLGPDLAAGITALKALPGRDIATVGSATLVRSLLREGLLDELHLLVHPIVVGSGARLFDDGPTVPLTLAASTTFSTGVLSLTYLPATA